MSFADNSESKNLFKIENFQEFAEESSAIIKHYLKENKTSFQNQLFLINLSTDSDEFCLYVNLFKESITSKIQNSNEIKTFLDSLISHAKSKFSHSKTNSSNQKGSSISLQKVNPTSLSNQNKLNKYKYNISDPSSITKKQSKHIFESTSDDYNMKNQHDYKQKSPQFHLNDKSKLSQNQLKDKSKNISESTSDNYNNKLQYDNKQKSTQNQFKDK
jgi:hypothetical protein